MVKKEDVKRRQQSGLEAVRHYNIGEPLYILKSLSQVLRYSII